MGIKVEKLDTPNSPWVVNSRMVGPIITLSFLIIVLIIGVISPVQAYGIQVIFYIPNYITTMLTLIGMVTLILISSVLIKKRFNVVAVSLIIGFAEIILAIYFLYLSDTFNTELTWNNGAGILTALITIMLVAYAPKKILERPYRIKETQKRIGFMGDVVVVKITNGNKWTYSHFFVKEDGGVYTAYTPYGIEAVGNSLREAINNEITTMKKVLNGEIKSNWGIDWNKPLHTLLKYDPKKWFNDVLFQNFAEFGTPLNAQKYSPEEYDGNDNFDEEGSSIPTPQPNVYGKPAGAKPIKEKKDDDYACYS